MKEYSHFTVNGLPVYNIKNNSGLVSIGIGMLAGSNFETPDVAGVAHFAEHMFFKGTKKRNYRDINTDFARYGAEANAYTSNNEVYYYATGAQKNISKFSEVLLDMVFNSEFPEEELEKERGVITEEKNTYNDDASSFFYHDWFSKLFTWDKGHPILGEFETIDSITRANIVNYLDSNVNKNNIAFICCGDIGDDNLRDIISENISEDHSFLKDGERNVADDSLFAPDYPDTLELKTDKFDQSIVSLVMEGFPSDGELSVAQKITANMLGGGAHSILYNKIREELGLCYHVMSYDHSIAYPKGNIFVTTCYTSPDNIDLFKEEVMKTVNEIVKNGFDEEIFECAKNDMTTSILRATETSSDKGSVYVKRVLEGNMDEPDLIDKIDDVKIEDCNQVLGNLINSKSCWASMVPEGE